MRSRNNIDPNTFQALFAPTLRVQFAWQELLAANWPVDMKAVVSAEELDCLHLPWYQKGWSRQAVGYEHPQARALQVGEFPKALAWQPQARQDSLCALAEWMREYYYPQLLMAPAAALEDGRIILLDGCHHAVAIKLAGVDFSLALFVAHPPTADALSDLQALARTVIKD